MKPHETAEVATEALRTLGQLTTSHYAWPAEVYAVIVELTLLVRELPKVVAQAATWLDTEHDVGRTGCDDDQNVTLTVHGTVMALHEAARHADPLLRALNTATRHAAHLTARTR
jgi:hypothetical protein